MAEAGLSLLASGAAKAIGKSNREAMAVGVELHNYRSAGANQSSAAPSETAAAVANQQCGALQEQQRGV